MHELLADGIPELALHSLFTRSGWDLAWKVEMSERIHPVSFAVGTDLYRNLWGRPCHDWRKASRIIRYCRENNIKVVILNGYASLVSARILRWCRRQGIPVFVRSDSNIKCDSSRGVILSWLKRRIVTWLVSQCDGVMPMGRLGAEYYKRYGATTDRLFWSPSIPDYEMFADVPEEKTAEFMSKEGLDADRRRILFCGRLNRAKRVDLLLDAFARIAVDRPEWDLIIAGGGPLEDELRKRLREDLADRVKWLGFRQWEDLPPAYAVSDVFVLPSDFEPWALVVIEAMAAGLAVIASDIVQAAHEICEDGVSGRLFKAGSVDSLTEALLEVTDLDNLRQYKKRASPALARWREQRDPVDWTRRALASVGLISA
ncbi:MAG: glycosyltransferase family 4 protein [Phycisphaerales bacterium]|nr:MAG: glycosyltransferase family 4 protein [Phycisphaerales bacterium]